MLRRTPSLQRFLQDDEWIEKYYRRARRDAAKKIHKSIEIFPAECPYTIKQVLNISSSPANWANLGETATTFIT
ncbi:DUF29 family protein [Gloeocapsopsis crepidinum]|uniref:DUF29 family protein n=1 Tax=Gloeocapsopsis crepidinum TaxID=693223 RepID=UPI001D156BB9|nr:DUF29 family protein [Gloeocapsopsis crepidinum]